MVPQILPRWRLEEFSNHSGPGQNVREDRGTLCSILQQGFLCNQKKMAMTDTRDRRSLLKVIGSAGLVSALPEAISDIQKRFGSVKVAGSEDEWLAISSPIMPCG